MTPTWMPSLVVPPCTSLDVALERDQEPLPRALRIDRGEHTAVRYERRTSSTVLEIHATVRPG